MDETKNKEARDIVWECIKTLEGSGWMAEHDKEVFENGYNDGWKDRGVSVCPGDEVVMKEGIDGALELGAMVVTHVHKNRVVGMRGNGEFGTIQMKYFKKTGKYYPEIVSLMEKIQRNEKEIH